MAKNQRRESGARVMRTAAAALIFAGALLTSAAPAFANDNQGGSGDNGGNGEGGLLIYPSLQDAQSGTHGSDKLTAGGTYYFVLTNPGGKASETNLKNLPGTLTFDFYNPPENFQGNPEDSSRYTPAFTVKGTEQGSNSPHIYSVKVPSDTTAGDYSIATFSNSSSQPMSDGNPGEDEFFFSTDPSINGGNIQISAPPVNNLPEVPLAGALPLIAAGAGVALYAAQRRRRTAAR